MELKKLTNKVYYIPNVVNIGCIVVGENAILIDTGIDDSVAKKTINILNNEGLTIKGIINTHSHADHCGGNAYIKQKTGAKIYAPEIEESIIKYPYLEPIYLFSGASPVEELRSKFFMAKSSSVDYIIGNNEECVCIEDINLNIINLPGHSINQIGIEVDNVLFCADSLVGEEVLNKHKIPFNMDIEKQKETLTLLKNSIYDVYVPSHCEPIRDIKNIAQINLDVLDNIDISIINIIEEKKTIEEIIRAICEVYKIKIANIGQYYLLNTTIMSHVSYLAKMKKVKSVIENNLIYWVII